MKTLIPFGCPTPHDLKAFPPTWLQFLNCNLLFQASPREKPPQESWVPPRMTIHSTTISTSNCGTIVLNPKTNHGTKLWVTTSYPCLRPFGCVVVGLGMCRKQPLGDWLTRIRSHQLPRFLESSSAAAGCSMGHMGSFRRWQGKSVLNKFVLLSNTTFREMNQRKRTYVCT